MFGIKPFLIYFWSKKKHRPIPSSISRCFSQRISHRPPLGCHFEAAIQVNRTSARGVPEATVWGQFPLKRPLFGALHVTFPGCHQQVNSWTHQPESEAFAVWYFEECFECFIFFIIIIINNMCDEWEGLTTSEPPNMWVWIQVWRCFHDTIHGFWECVCFCVVY